MFMTSSMMMRMTMINNGVTREEYIENQQKVRELCNKFGLKERKAGYEYQFWIPTHPRIFAECVRLFDYDEHPTDRVVFFYDLEPYSFRSEYDYCFDSSLANMNENLNLDVRTNHFEFPLTNSDIRKLETIIKADIQIAKEYSEQLTLNDVKTDFV